MNMHRVYFLEFQHYIRFHVLIALSKNNEHLFAAHDGIKFPWRCQCHQGSHQKNEGKQQRKDSFHFLPGRSGGRVWIHCLFSFKVCSEGICRVSPDGGT